MTALGWNESGNPGKFVEALPFCIDGAERKRKNMGVETSRREFIKTLTTGLATGLLASSVEAAPRGKVKAIAFDAFPIFDPRPIFGLLKTMVPDNADELGNQWRARQFQYQWLHALSGNYRDFWSATEASLVYAAKSLKVNLTPEMRRALMDGYLQLRTWPDVPDRLQTWKDAGLQLALLSNATPRILEAAIRNSKIEGLFTQVMSTDSIKTYKPDPRAYGMGVDNLGLKKEEIVFAAFAGWDVAGAKWFGYPTYWVNRTDALMEELGVMPDGIGRNMADLGTFVADRR